MHDEVDEVVELSVEAALGGGEFVQRRRQTGRVSGRVVGDAGAQLPARHHLFQPTRLRKQCKMVRG